MTAATLDFGYRLPWLFDTTASAPIKREEAKNPYAQAYVIPELGSDASPTLAHQVKDLARMTEWTNRTLGLVIGVSHPTVAKILRGDLAALSRSQEARERIVAAYEVVQRLYVLAGRNPHRLADALDTPDRSDQTAIDYLIDREVPTAYLVAARRLRPARDGKMMLGRNPIDPRTAKVAVFDEE